MNSLNTGNNAVMWEVRAAQNRQQQLLSWVSDILVRSLSHHSGCRDAHVYRSDEQRVVVIAHGDDPPEELPEPPQELVARRVRQWPFALVASHNFREQP